MNKEQLEAGCALQGRIDAAIREIASAKRWLECAQGAHATSLIMASVDSEEGEAHFPIIPSTVNLAKKLVETRLESLEKSLTAYEAELAAL